MGIIDDVKEAVKLGQEINNLELYRKLLDLQHEAIELTQQLKDKDKNIGQLKKALELKGKMDIIDSVYWLTDEQGKAIDGPFCPKCNDVDHIQCRVSPLPPDFHPGVQCPNCKSNFESSLAITYIEDQKKAGQGKVLGR